MNFESFFQWILCVILFLTCPFLVFTQQNKIDSLKKVLSVSKEDTTRINLLIILAKTVVDENLDSAFVFAKKALEISEMLNNSNFIGYASSTCGVIKQLQGVYAEAIIFDNQAIKAFQKDRNEKMIQEINNNIGSIYLEIGKIVEALNFHLNAARYFEKTEDKNQMARTYTLIGNIYTKKRDFDNALKYYNRALMNNPEAEPRGIALFEC